jgi:hypothetical protein
LIAEVETAISAADVAGKEARAIAADPKVIDCGAIGRATDAEHTAHRLRNGLSALQDLHREATLREQIKAWNLRADEVQIKRDALGAELAERWPTLCAWAADIFAQIKVCDAEIAKINETAVGYEGRRLVDCELHARGLTNWMSHDIRLTEKAVLPTLVIGQHGAVDAWPPRPVPISMDMMAIFPRNGTLPPSGKEPVRCEMIDGEPRMHYSDGSISPPNKPPGPSPYPISDIRDQIGARQLEQMEDGARLAKLNEEQQLGRQALNNAQAERAAAYEAEQRKLRSGAA